MKARGFQKLRIAAAASGTVLASLFGAVTKSARASTNLPVTYTSSTRWQAKSSDCAERFGLAGDQCGLGLRQFAQVDETTTTIVPPPPTFPTSSTTPSSSPTTSTVPTTNTPPPTTASTQGADSLASKGVLRTRKNDAISEVVAFDGSLGLAVGNVIFQAPKSKVDLTTDALVAGPQLIDGLETSVQYQFFGDLKAVRATFVFSNTTNSAIDVDMRTNIGGFSGNAAIGTTPHEENSIDAVDRWYETIGADAADDSSPSVLFVACGNAGRWTLPSISKISFHSGGTEYVNRYEFKVRPGDSVAIMVFAQSNAHALDAKTVDATFANLLSLYSAGLLDNLPVAREKIVNWNYPARIVGPPPVNRRP
jgi:hypothetical protein